MNDDYDKAIADSEKAFQLDPEYCWVSNQLAWLLSVAPDPKNRDPQRAVELARHSISLYREYGDAWNTLGVALYRRGQWKESLEALQESNRLNGGGDSFDWFFIAMIHHRLGNDDEATRWRGKAVDWMERNQPKDPELSRFRAEADALFSN